MMRNELKINSELIYKEQKYIVLGINPPNVTIKRCEGDEVVISINFIELVSNNSFRSGKKIIKDIQNELKTYKFILDNIPDKKREAVSNRLDLIRPILTLRECKLYNIRAITEFKKIYGEYLLENENLQELTQESLIERIAYKNKRSVRTIKRYLKSYRESNLESLFSGEEALIPKSGSGYFSRKDNKKLEICHPKHSELVLDVIDIRIDEKYIPIIKETIENEYLTLKQISKKAVYGSIEAKCVRSNIEPPVEITIYKLLDRINPLIKTKMRKGKKAFEQFEDVDRGFSNKEALFPLHIVEIDHTQLDLDVIDENTGFVIGRPWITLGIDVFSRCVWCMHISFESPSANKVRKALENGLFFKNTKQKYDTLNEWEVFGIPTIIYFDNGPEFKNAAVKRMVNEVLHSNIMYRPVKTPRYGATIERLFGTINSELIHRLSGTRKSNPRELGEYDAEKEAIFTLGDIEEVLTTYITDVYHHSEHNSLPLDSNTPMIRYYEGLAKVGYPEFISAEYEEEYKLELFPTTERPYTRDGVRLNNVIYKSEEFKKYIAKREVKYKVKYDVDDISRIYIMKPDLNEYVELRAVNASIDIMEGMSLFTYNKLIEIYREEGTKKRTKLPGSAELLIAKEKLQNKIESKYKRNRIIRQQAKRTGIEVTILERDTENSKIKEQKPKLSDLLAKAREIERNKQIRGERNE